MILFRIFVSLNLAGLVLIGALQAFDFPQPSGLSNSQKDFGGRWGVDDGMRIRDCRREGAAPGGTYRAAAANPAPAKMQAPGGTEKKRDSSYRREKIEEWLAALAAHKPGRPEPAAAGIGRWDEGDLEIPVDFVTKLASGSSSAKRTLARASTRRLLHLTDQEAREGNLNRILKQGAMLHTDIALLGLEKRPPPLLGGQMGVFADGRLGMQPKKVHWKFARRLLDSVSPSPARDPMVRKWYIATTAHMLNQRLLAYAGRNIERALEIFPSDDKILFYAGVLHETWASPCNQNILLPPLSEVIYGSKGPELKRARHFFRESIARNPDFPEAHLRLGRVLGLLGTPQQAVAELQLAAPAKDPQLLYYASLFLGRECEMLSRRTDARNHYQRAASLYPAAQSPLFALSQLAHSGDDAEGALVALQRIFESPVRDFWKDDPRWVYDLAPVRDADQLIAEIYSLFGEVAQ